MDCIGCYAGSPQGVVEEEIIVSRLGQGEGALPTVVLDEEGGRCGGQIH